MLYRVCYIYCNSHSILWLLRRGMTHCNTSMLLGNIEYLTGILEETVRIETEFIMIGNTSESHEQQKFL